MSLSHRVGSGSSPAGALDVAPESPPAVRGRVSRWADPRLWVGLLLVVVSLIAGARILAAADDTITVWRLNHDLMAGSAVTSADLTPTRVHFADAADEQRYLSATTSPPAGARLTRDIGAGELLAVSAVTTDGSAAVQQQLPLGVAAAGVPAGLSPGDRVDVWAVPSSDAAQRGHPIKVLADVTVTAVNGSVAGGLGADRQILVALTEGTVVGRALAALDQASVVLIQNGA